MFTATDFIRTKASPSSHQERLSAWLRDIPLYQKAGSLDSLSYQEESLETALSDLPFITKREIRDQFPHNFLQAGMDLEALVDQELVELEHTSGTSEERIPLLLPYGWWAEQETRALRLNRLATGILDEFPDTRRVAIEPTDLLMGESSGKFRLTCPA